MPPETASLVTTGQAYPTEFEIPIYGLLTHAEELKTARRISLCLKRLRTFLPRHPLGYRCFLARMEKITSGLGPAFPWHKLKESIPGDLKEATGALKRAEHLATRNRAAALATFEEGVTVFRRYPLDPETLYHWALVVSKRPAHLGPLGELERIQKVARILRSVRRTLNEARDCLVLRNLRLVLQEAFRYRARGMYKTDLFQEGILGLHKAVFRFDPTRKLRFATYATYWIRQTIRKALSDKSSLVRLPQSMKLKLRQKPAELMTPQEARWIRQLQADPYFFSAFAAKDDAAFDVPDRRSTEHLHTDDIPQAVAAALLLLPDLEREILKKRFGLDGAQEHTLVEVGSQFNLSHERVRQLEAAALVRMRRYRDLRETYEELVAREPAAMA